ncbi:MAG: dksa/trar family transcriptional regulator [Pseudonocardiaceae bacterium]|nr:dksa/trar family transcriptional regulator [Pseudonocardiaceae bacterium]
MCSAVVSFWIPVTNQAPDSALSPAEQQAVRDRLAAQRASTTSRVESLARHHHAIVESAAWSASDDEHDPEGATVAFERAQVRALLDQARRDLDSLDRAARRLRDGTYGRCERCDETIADQRLAALPAATSCIRCATTSRR